MLVFKLLFTFFKVRCSIDNSKNVNDTSRSLIDRSRVTPHHFYNHTMFIGQATGQWVTLLQ
jgi:hypothetical protein